MNNELGRPRIHFILALQQSFQATTLPSFDPLIWDSVASAVLGSALDPSDRLSVLSVGAATSVLVNSVPADKVGRSRAADAITDCTAVKEEGEGVDTLEGLCGALAQAWSEEDGKDDDPVNGKTVTSADGDFAGLHGVLVFLQSGNDRANLGVTDPQLIIQTLQVRAAA